MLLGKQDECSICLEMFALNQEAKKLPCDHIYHSQCISKWVAIVSQYKYNEPSHNVNHLQLYIVSSLCFSRFKSHTRIKIVLFAASDSDHASDCHAIPECPYCFIECRVIDPSRL